MVAIPKPVPRQPTIEAMDRAMIIARIFAKTSSIPFAGCRIWIGYVNKHGYGVTSAGGGKQWLVHRLIWSLHGGEIPAGKVVMHSCDVRCCVNLSHLSLGTNQDNMSDMAAKKRYRLPYLSGEQHPNAKLSLADVKEIRESKDVPAVLAAKFCVNVAHISNIRRGKVWR